jgi:hypothetical protein
MKLRRGKAKLIDQWSKGDGDVIRVELTKYRGHDMISIRTWKPGPDGEDQALKNGITLTVGHLPKLAKALRKATRRPSRPNFSTNSSLASRRNLVGRMNVEHSIDNNNFPNGHRRWLNLNKACGPIGRKRRLKT